MPAKKQQQTQQKPKPKRAQRRRRGGPRPVRNQQPQQRHVAAVTNRAPAGRARPVFLGMALPEEHPKLRLPTACVSRTAVLTLKDNLTLNTSLRSDLEAPGVSYVALLGQPGRTMLVKTERLIRRKTTADDVGYLLHFATPLGKDSSKWHVKLPAPELESAGTVIWNVNIPWSVIKGVSSSNVTNPIHGKVMPAGRSQTRDWIFLNAGETLVLNHISSWDLPPEQLGWSGQVRFTLEYATDGTSPTQVSTNTGSVGSGASNVAILIGVTGHYSVSLTVVEVNTIAANQQAPDYGAHGMTWQAHIRVPFTAAALTVNTNYWAIVNHRTLEGDNDITNAARTTACSLLASNTTAEMYKQGTITAARVHDREPWNITDDDLEGFSERYSAPASLGVYTFLEITEQMEEYRDHASTASHYTGLRYDLDMPGPVHLIRFEAPTTAPNIFRLAMVTTVEFRTDSQKYSNGTAPGTVLDLQAARRLLNSRPEWFYHNPEHMARIYRLLGAIGRGAKRYGPMAARVAGVLNPANAGAYNLLASGLGALSL